MAKTKPTARQINHQQRPVRMRVLPIVGMPNAPRETDIFVANAIAIAESNKVRLENTLVEAEKPSCSTDSSSPLSVKPSVTRTDMSGSLPTIAIEATNIKRLEAEPLFRDLNHNDQNRTRDVFIHYIHINDYALRSEVSFTLIFSTRAHRECTWPKDEAIRSKSDIIMSLVEYFEAGKLYNGDNSDGRIDTYIQHVRQVFFDLQQDLKDSFDSFPTKSNLGNNYPYDALYYVFMGGSFPSSVIARKLASDAFRFILKTLFFSMYHIDTKWKKKFDFSHLIRMMNDDEIDHEDADTMLYDSLNFTICRMYEENLFRSFKGTRRDMSTLIFRSIVLFYTIDDGLHIIFPSSGWTDMSIKAKGTAFWDACALHMMDRFNMVPNDLKSILSADLYNTLSKGGDVVKPIAEVNISQLVSASHTSLPLLSATQNRPRDINDLPFREKVMFYLNSTPDKKYRVVFIEEESFSSNDDDYISKLEAKLDILTDLRSRDEDDKFKGASGQITDLLQIVDEARKRETARYQSMKMTVVPTHTYRNITLPFKLAIRSTYSSSFISDMRISLNGIQDYDSLKNEEQKLVFSNFATQQILANMEGSLISAMGNREAIVHNTDFNGVFKKISNHFAGKGDRALDCFNGLLNMSLSKNEDPTLRYLSDIDNRLKQLIDQRHPLAYDLLIQRWIAGLHVDFKTPFTINWTHAISVIDTSAGPMDHSSVALFKDAILKTYRDLSMSKSRDYNKSQASSSSYSRSGSGQDRSNDRGADKYRGEKRNYQTSQSGGSSSIHYTSSHSQSSNLRPRRECICSFRVCTSKNCDYLHTVESHPEKFPEDKKTK